MPIEATYNVGMALSDRAYTGNRFLFSLDDPPLDAGFVKSCSGGQAKGSVLREQVGPDNAQFKHLGAVEIEPLQLELGMALSKPIFNWVRASWNREFVRKSGSIVHADGDFHGNIEHSFHDALITETKFSTLEKKGSKASYLSLSLQPELVGLKKANESRLWGRQPPQQKQWTNGAFRLEIDGIDCTYVSKIDSFTVKQSIKKLYIGSARYPEIEPTGIEFSDLSIYMALPHAAGFMKWHDEFVVQGRRDTKEERQGRIVFLAPNHCDELFSIILQNVGIFSFNVEQSSTESDEIKRAKVEMYVEKMTLKDGSGVA